MGDTPNFSESSEADCDISLGQAHTTWCWWCHILAEALQPYRAGWPPREYADRLLQLQPALARLTASIDKTSDELRQEMTARVAASVAAAFN